VYFWHFKRMTDFPITMPVSLPSSRSCLMSDDDEEQSDCDQQFPDTAFYRSMAQVRSGSLDGLSAGLSELRNMTIDTPLASLKRFQESDSVAFLLSLTRIADLSDDVRGYLVSIFSELADSGDKGVEFLLSHDIPLQLLELYDVPAVPTPADGYTTFGTVVDIVRTLTCSSVGVSMKIVDQGLYHKCVSVFSRLVDHKPSDISRVALIMILGFGDLSRNVPLESLDYFRATLPTCVRLLKAPLHLIEYDVNSDLICALLRFLALPDSQGRPAADWVFLYETGAIARAFELAQHNFIADSAMEFFCAAAAQTDSATKLRVFGNDKTLSRIACLVGRGVGCEDFDQFPGRMRLLAHLAAEPELRPCFASGDLLATLPRRAAPRIRSRWYCRNTSDWSEFVDAATQLFRHLLADPRTRAAMAPMLLSAGAMHLLTAALAQEDDLDCDVANPGRVACVTALICSGSTARDDEYIHHGAALANPYLAAFCAAGASAVLGRAVAQFDDVVLDLFNTVIGPIVGAEGRAEAQGEVPPQFLAFSGLTGALEVDDDDLDSRDDEGDVGGFGDNNGGDDHEGDEGDVGLFDESDDIDFGTDDDGKNADCIA
jgi:hypothetical protein